MTPDEANGERRKAAIRRAHRIDALEPSQLANFIHRLATIVPGDIDRVLGEFDANTPKSRTEKMLHPVTFYSDEDRGGLLAYCELEQDWHEHIDDGHTLSYLEDLVRVHSGIRP